MRLRFWHVLLFVVVASAIFIAVEVKRRITSWSEYSGYNLYVGKKPFSILVERRFPENRSFLVVTEKNATVFSFKQSKNQRGWANVSVGTDIDADERGTVDRSGPVSVRIRTDAHDKPLQLWLFNRGENNDDQVLQDLDLSGTWDIKRLPMQKSQFIWFGNAWQSVETVSGTDHEPVTAMSNATSYFFDRADGMWKTAHENLQPPRPHP
jgi:hypothetical protein